MNSKCDDIQKSWMRTNKEFNFSTRGEIELRRKILRSRWDDSINVIKKEISASITSSSLSECKIESWFQRIVDLHSDVKRYYHTLCHLEEMFGYLDLLLLNPFEKKNQLEFERDNITTISSRRSVTSSTNDGSSVYKAIISLSVFFHDAVYDPKSVTNEEDSVALFQEFHQDLFSTSDGCRDDGDDDEGNAVQKSVTCWYGFDMIKKFILATKSHSADDVDMIQAEKLYLNIFLDADMSVLGKSLEAYLHYASLIRREYAHVPRNVYCQKRADVLRSFIENVGAEGTKTIFLDDTMRDALEVRAVQNLQFEIEVLNRGLIPGEDNII
jgi:predicted metal-dependent HD superfamily phosphohydrolase